MKRFLQLTLLAAAALASFGKADASAQTMTNLITNGDFSSNGAAFVNYPGYLGSGSNGSNPATIPGYTFNGSGGLNGTGTGAGSPFAPDGYPNPAFPAPSFYLFIQNAGTVTQTINLTAGDMYTLSFVGAPRGRNNGTASVSISNGIFNFSLTPPSTSVGSTVFTQVTGTFTAPAVLTGNSVLTLTNGGGTGDSVNDFTEDFANFSLVDNSPAAPAPEPATYALLGLGALALCLASRRAARTA